MIKEYQVQPNDLHTCFVCKGTEDIVLDDDGDTICTDCLFERESEREYLNDND